MCKSDAGWHIIDTGFHTDTARSAWRETFKTLGISPTDVVEIVLTHYHPDHLGMAGVLQEMSKAPVKISSIDYKHIQSMWMIPIEINVFDQLAKEHGMSEELRNIIYAKGKENLQLVRPFPEFTTFEEGETFYWGETFVAIHAPGHADGHMVFYSENSRLLVCGDVLLPKITPNIGYLTGMNPNPLGSYLHTLEKLQKYSLDMVLPGHRNIYADGNRRADELVNHHRQRLREILDVIVQPLTAAQITRIVFSHINSSRSAMQHRFAFQETLAHLIYLEQNGEVVRKKTKEGIYVFSRKPAENKPQERPSLL